MFEFTNYNRSREVSTVYLLEKYKCQERVQSRRDMHHYTQRKANLPGSSAPHELHKIETIKTDSS